MAAFPKVKARDRLPDSSRSRVGLELRLEYEAGASIRQLCGHTGYSIGRVRRLLDGAGVVYRARGGANSAC